MSEAAPDTPPAPALFQAAAEGVCVCSPCNEPPFLLFSMWNQRLVEITGYTRDEINRDGWHRLLHPDPEMQQAYLRRLERVMNGDHLRAENWPIFHRDGNARTVQLSTSEVEGSDGRTALLAIVRDVTEEHARHELLRLRERRLRVLLENAFEGISILDRHGKILYRTENYERILGWPVRDRSDDDPLSHVHPDDLPAAQSILEQLLANDGMTVTNVQMRIADPQGYWRWLEASGRSMLTDPDIQGILINWRDISDRKAAEETLQKQEQHLQEAQKLDSLGVLAGGIAHDFNNLLTPILGYAGLAANEVPADSPVQGYLERIEAAARRAAQLCQQMLAYAGQGQYIIGPVDLSALVEEMISLAQVSLPPAARVELSLDPDLVPIQADATQLRQVVMNLILNAGEALVDGQGEIRIRTMQCDGHVCLSVEDSGCGMTPQTQARIFEPFFTTKFTGRGLGLPAVLGIVRRHVGRLEIDSSAGRGTTFRVYLPCTPREGGVDV